MYYVLCTIYYMLYTINTHTYAHTYTTLGWKLLVNFDYTCVRVHVCVQVHVCVYMFMCVRVHAKARG